METNKEDNTLIYHSAHRGKRLLASLCDFIFTILLAMTIFSISAISMENTPFTQDIINAKREMEIDSSLYEESTSLIIYEYVDTLENYSEREKKDYLKEHLDLFYASKYVSKEDLAGYNQRRIEAKYGDVPLFKKVGEEILEEEVNPLYLFNFYKYEIEDHAAKTLFLYEGFADATRNIFLYFMIIFVISLTISVSVFYLVFPLWIFKRGRQTLGKKLLKLSLIASNALNVSAPKYLLRFLFIFLVYYVLDFFSFLLPLFISLGMLFFSKRKESLIDYLFSQYVIDSSVDTIYLDYGDYLSAKRAKEEASIENNDFLLKR